MEHFFIYTISGIRISLAIITAAIILHFFPLQPKFVIPQRLYKKEKYLLAKISYRTLLISAVLLPLDIQLVKEQRIITEKNIPVQIVFDVSLSMTADDIKPSRFVAAKQALLRLMKKLEGYNISVITFSGIPFVYIPFGTNTDAQITKFERTNLGDFPPTPNFVGTAIGDALLLALENLQRNVGTGIENPGIIILMTDGDSNKGTDPNDVIPLAQKKNIPIFTLGIGENNYLVGYDYLNNPIKTSINVELLEKIAKDTNAEFYRVLEDQSLEQIFKQIASMITAHEKDTLQYDYEALNKYLLIVIVIMTSVLLGQRTTNKHGL